MGIKDAYIHSDPVPVDVYIDGQKVNAPRAGVKIGRPFCFDIQGDRVEVAFGDFIKEGAQTMQSGNIDPYITTAELYINKLLDNIRAYYCRHGEMPKFILVTTGMYWLMENYATRHFALRAGAQPVPYFRGIEVRIVSGDGYEVFLCGEHIKMRE